MNVFQPTLHTPDQLADTISNITARYPNAILAGGLGRASLYQDVYGDPEYEFRHRDQNPVTRFEGKSVADIDIINGASIAHDDASPFELDLLAFNNQYVSIVNEDGVWRLESKRQDFVSELDSAIFEPVRATTVYGAECNTVSAQTHLALFGLAGPTRIKDQVAIDLLSKTIEEENLATLPAELYEPFVELAKLQFENLPLARVRQLYRNSVPLTIRRAVSPFTIALLSKFE